MGRIEGNMPVGQVTSAACLLTFDRSAFGFLPSTIGDEGLDVGTTAVDRHFAVLMTERPKADFVFDVGDVLRCPAVVTQGEVRMQGHFIAVDAHLFDANSRRPKGREPRVSR